MLSSPYLKVLIPPSLEYGESGVGEGASQNSGPNASFDVELEPTHESQENANHAPAPANSNTSSHVHSFTTSNIPLFIHQTPTPIHPSTDPTFDPVHPDSISDPVHPSNEQDSDRELLNGGFNRSDVDEVRSFRKEKSKRKRRKKGERALLPDHVKLGTKKKDEAASFETNPDAFSDDEEEVQQRERVKPKRRKKVNRVVFDVSSQKIVWELGLVFESVNEFRSNVTKYVVAEYVAIEMCINEPTMVLQDNTAKSMKCSIEWNSDTGYEPAKKRKQEQGETSKTEKLSKKGVEMLCNTCHNKGHNKRKCPFGAPASSTNFIAGPSSRPPSGPSSSPRATPVAATPTSIQIAGPAGPRATPDVAPTSTQTAGPKATPNAPTEKRRGRSKGSTEKFVAFFLGSVASRIRMVGMGVLHTKSGATIINPGMPSERFRNVKSSTFVTRDLGHKPTCGVKWKRKQAMTSSQLKEMRGENKLRLGLRLLILAKRALMLTTSNAI
ncbi:hypothetical protein H5410_059732 [Solanum commersonii]|uniref:Uncharacterized protein n=1 Tax=Solanum commersonii TaxID=4109 RepID=A0A9J5W4C9_SOLCO|nr:hypothetical protein H5410_059732 [Solanum commersonii]